MKTFDPASLPPPSMSSDSSAAQQLGAFDPSDEYRKLLELTDPHAARRLKKGKGAPGPSDLSGRLPDSYQYLMSRERRVLDTVDRVVNDSIVRDAGASSIFGVPVHELAMRTVGAIRALLDDLIAARSVSDVSDAIRAPRRLPYLGVALVSVALILAALQCMQL
jgi:hypothetical protein